MSFSAMNGPATGIRIDFAHGSSLNAKEAPTPRPYQPTRSAPPVTAKRPEVPGSGVAGLSAGLGAGSTATSGSSASASLGERMLESAAAKPKAGARREPFDLMAAHSAPSGRRGARQKGGQAGGPV